MTRSVSLRKGSRDRTGGCDLERRKFLKTVLTGAVVSVGILGMGTTAEARVQSRFAGEVLRLERESDLVRMTRELQEALKKPMAERKWVMVIDLRKCVGCNSCTVSCIAENKTPPGITYRPVMIWESGEYPNVKLNFLPRPCMQCDDPPCVPVCPVYATWKREDGIVVIDYDKCIGCRYCVMACPYGARSTDYGYEWAPEFSPGPLAGDEAKIRHDRVDSLEYQPTPWFKGPYDRGSTIGITRKCHFCIHRIESGVLPACVTTCIGGATYFGDSRDPGSLVNEVLRRNGAFRLKEELGTEPSVYYITGEGGASVISEMEEVIERYRKELMARELSKPIGVPLRGDLR